MVLRVCGGIMNVLWGFCGDQGATLPCNLFFFGGGKGNGIGMRILLYYIIKDKGMERTIDIQ